MPTTLLSTVPGPTTTVDRTVVQTKIVQTTVTSVIKAPASTSASPALGTPVPVGTTVDLGPVKATVLDVKRHVDVPSASAAAGMGYAAVEVRVCIINVKPSATLSWHPWVLAGSDGAQYAALNVLYSDLPQPAYPFAGEQFFLDGECAQGWIGFDAPTNNSLAMIRYSTVGADGVTPLLARWRI